MNYKCKLQKKKNTQNSFFYKDYILMSSAQQN